jgi:hypothetical protein
LWRDPIDKTGYDFGYINFDFGINSINELELLNEYAFNKSQYRQKKLYLCGTNNLYEDDKKQ